MTRYDISSVACQQQIVKAGKYPGRESAKLLAGIKLISVSHEDPATVQKSMIELARELYSIQAASNRTKDWLTQEGIVVSNGDPNVRAAPGEINEAIQ